MGFPHYPGDCAEHHHLVRDFKTRRPRPVIITLCGSTRFREAFEHAMRDWTLENAIVIPPVWVHEDPAFVDGEPDVDLAQVKADLDALHLRKIDLCDLVFVINVGGYVGESTAREIAYAKALGRQVMYLEFEGDDVFAPRASASDVP